MASASPKSPPDTLGVFGYNTTENTHRALGALFTIIRAARKNYQVLCMGVFILLCLFALGLMFSIRGKQLMEQQLKDKLRSTAAIAAMQFDGNVLDTIHGRSSMHRPAFKDVVNRLRAIRASSPSIRFAYIMRRTADPDLLEFVADADSLASPQELDRNRNGLIDPAEEASYPGDTYDISEVPALQERAFDMPTTDDVFTYDQWGVLISGYAPITNVQGRVVAVLGMDMDAKEFLSATSGSLSPVMVMFLSLIAVFLASLIALVFWQREYDALSRIDDERRGLLLLASHQLGAPLAVFRWSLECLMEEAHKPGGDIYKALGEYIPNAEHGIQQLMTIFTALQEASQVDGGRIQYHPTLVRVSDVIREVVKDLQKDLDSRQQKVDFQMDAQLHLDVDSKLIAGVLRELIENAMAFSPHGSTITIVAKRGQSRAFVEVADTGYGIPQKDLGRVFGKFVRGSNAAIHHPNGMGLGLYVAQGTVRCAGGDIWVDSKEGQGTKVTFTLPS